MTRRHCHPSAQLIAILLTCSLLLAQWAGLQHRVAHAHLQQAELAYIDGDRSAKDSPDKNSFHSCTLLDASAMGASLPACDRPPLLPRIASLPITVLPLVSWQALFTRQFSSRAPPFFS